MIICNEAFDTYRKEYSKPIGQWVHLSFVIFAIFDVKKQLAFDGFRPRSNMTDISYVMGMFSYQLKSKCTVGTLIFHGFDDS